MSRRSHPLLATAASLLLATASACGSNSPTGPEAARFSVELRNFGTGAWDMGLQGGSLVTITGDPSTGPGRLIEVDNPGIGNSLTFVAVSGTNTLSVTCTVTSSTNVSELPQVVIQPTFEVLDCVSW